MIHYDPRDAVPGGESLPSLRRRILLGLLAEQECERLGLVVDGDDLRAMARWFRESFDLQRGADLGAFMRDAGLSREAMSEQLRTLCQVTKAQAHHAPCIETMLPRYYAFAMLDGGGRGT